MVARIVLVVACFLAGAGHAVNFRWSSQGDAATMDPHSQNETFNNGINQLVYEPLATRTRKDYAAYEPALAVGWSNPEPTKWIFNLRRGVKFQDGTPFTADDVVFTFNRARESAVTFKLYATQSGVPRKIDDYTVEFTTPVPNPVMLDTVTSVYVMSKAWCEKHGVARPQNFVAKEETYSVRNAMGTGPYRLVTWEPGVKLLHEKNKDWWGLAEGRYEGNVDTLEYHPIANPATRMAALKSGQLDFVLDPPVQDVARLRTDPDIRVWEGRELRVIFLGLDQARDELLYSTVKGKNPFKDKRVRRALYQAIDVNALKTQVMRGLSLPTGIALPDAKGAGVPDSYEVRLPYDPAASRKLLAEAGYPQGFGFTLTCPSDRYVNDEKLCVAAAAMWARIGLDVKVESMPKSNYFPKAQRRDTSAYLLGWGGGSSDSIFILKPVFHSRNAAGAGDANYGDANNAELDALIDRLEGEMDAAKRQEMVNRAVKIVQDEVLVMPLHVQVIPWASRRNVTVVHRPNNILIPMWTTIK